MKRHERNARYSRILVAGITLSIAAHFALFKLAGFDFQWESAGDAVVLTPPPSAPAADEAEPSRPAEAAAPDGLPEIEMDALVALDLAEYPRVLTEADVPVIPPLVPRPRIRPERLDQGFTPVRLASRTARRSSGSDGGSSIGITFVVGAVGGHDAFCPPTRTTHLPIRFSRQGPASPSLSGLGAFLPRR